MLMFTQNRENLASINGKITHLSKAKISLADRGVLFGHAIFETLLVKNRNMIQWDEHFKRLSLGCKKIDIICPDESQLKQQCSVLIDKFFQTVSNEPCSLKILITGGDYPVLSLPMHKSDRPLPNVYILCQKAPFITNEARLKGIKVKSYLDERVKSLKTLKTTDYLYNYLCLSDAQKHEYDDAIFKNEEDYFIEGVTSSFLWFDSYDCVYFTPSEGNCLESTSILKFIDIFKKNKIEYQYQMLNKNKATNCAGCALISSVRGYMPVKQIDDLSFNLAQYVDFHKRLIELFQLCE